VAPGSGSIETHIGRSPSDRKRMAVVTRGGKPAVTRYRVRELLPVATLVDIALATGRTHQIRVHMAHIRAPLVGDRVYGGRPKLPPAASDELRSALQGLRRQALHASRLRLTHPKTGAALDLTSPLPSDLAALLALLRADAARPMP
jgi:23S rRNA pseudouridine1911/1915/1917 synthase